MSRIGFGGILLKRSKYCRLLSSGYTTSKEREIAVIVHGGCGEYGDEKANKKLVGCKAAAVLGYKALQDTGNVVDAIEAAIKYFEDNPEFNCGYGSVLNEMGEVELEASIVHGKDLSYGGVMVVKDIAHPISLARLIMEKSPHVLLAGKGALDFAKNHGVPVLEPGALVTPQAKKLLEEVTHFGTTEAGTVGCCALDKLGNVAAGTSTGGLNRKMRGRCGDTATAGGGTYADNTTGAVSATGHGESCVKLCLTYNILHEIGSGIPAMDAATKCLKSMNDLFRQTAGVIVLTKFGEIAVSFTAPRMAWAAMQGGRMVYGSKMGEVLNN